MPSRPVPLDAKGYLVAAGQRAESGHLIGMPDA
jgi:hypothetical protein